jgi:hypothetical protein
LNVASESVKIEQIIGMNALRLRRVLVELEY